MGPRTRTIRAWGCSPPLPPPVHDPPPLSPPCCPTAGSPHGKHLPGPAPCIRSCLEGKRSHHCTAVCPSVSPRPPLPLPLLPTGSPCWDPHQAAIDSLKATMPLVPGAGVSIPGEHWPVGILAGLSLSDPCLGAVAQRESTSPLCSRAPFFHERKPTLFPPPWLFYGFRACDLRDLGSQSGI